MSFRRRRRSSPSTRSSRGPPPAPPSMIPAPGGLVAGMVAEAAAKYRPTVFPGAPPIYLAINQLKDVEKYDLRSIRACVSGSSALPVEVQKRFEELTAARL